jgi:hypothetical protein
MGPEVTDRSVWNALAAWHRWRPGEGDHPAWTDMERARMHAALVAGIGASGWPAHLEAAWAQVAALRVQVEALREAIQACLVGCVRGDDGTPGMDGTGYGGGKR